MQTSPKLPPLGGSSLLAANRDPLTGVDLFFFDTTSMYFEGEGGETLGAKGHSRDHRSDKGQLVIGTLIHDHGKPVCCETWPGNTADVKTLIPVADRVRNRFNVGQFCLVADQGMISKGTLRDLKDRKIPYILGTRMRRVKEIREEVLGRAGRYREVHPEEESSKDPSPLKVKEVTVGG